MKGRFLGLGLAALLTISLAACSSGNDGETAAEKTDTTTVEVMQVKSEPLKTEYNLSGTLQSADSTAVSFQASGEVKQTLVEVGDQVKEGDVLAILDDEPARLQLKQAQSGVAQAEGQVSAAKAGLATAEAQIRSAEANLAAVEKGASEEQIAMAQNQVKQAEDGYFKVKADAERYSNLYTEGLISLDDYEKTQIQLKNAENSLDSAKQQLAEVTKGATKEQREAAAAGLEQARSGKQSALAAKSQAEAGYKNAQAAREQAELALSKAKLTATVSGTVLEKMVVAGQAAGAGNPAFVIGSTTQLKVLLPVPDSEISAWKAGQKVDLALAGETRTGTVKRVYPQTNAGTGTISVEVSVPNPNKDWFPGQVVKAGLQVSGEQGILIPAEAVISNGQEPYVFRNVNGKAVKTPVKLGDEIVENRFRILSGLQVGDVIVSAGADGLFDGFAIATAEDAHDD
ncbi:efflux RND transporter periplasmic adaptor subunit [Paenibacillus phocaensis]|uniref:efflux RND transporter periplasmic adaptor subunit n=1 Tax=Paenibacillus phocaensis TaxID=1776378 RepID=UPI00039B733E|nr:efflux RND transporter periplasmic adaptor subunit [Paenibacillus phocaensis]